MFGKIKGLKTLSLPTISPVSFQNFMSNKFRLLREDQFQTNSKSLSLKESEPATIEKNYEISIAKKEDTGDILKFVEHSFLHDEPLTKSLKIGPTVDPILKALFCRDFQYGLSVVATKKDSNKEILGVCINQKCCKWDGDHLEKFSCKTQDPQVRKFLQMSALMYQEPRLHQKLSQDVIFNMKCLAVNHKNKELAENLVKSSLALARDTNYEFAQVICTNEFVRKQCEEIGMSLEWKIPYTNILLEDTCEPVAIPENPHNHVHVYYVNLKELPAEFIASNLK